SNESRENNAKRKIKEAMTEVRQNSYISDDMEDNNFREELLSCAKLLHLSSDDSIQDPMSQVTLEHFQIQDYENESIINEPPSETSLSPLAEIKNQLSENWVLNEVEEINNLLKEVLNDAKVTDIVLCEETCAHKTPPMMEEPLFSKRTQNDGLYPIPSLKDLSRQFPTNEISLDPFFDDEIDVLCPLQETFSREISLESDDLQDNDFEHMTPLEDYKSKWPLLYLEEPVITNKMNRVVEKDIPTSISDIIPLVMNEEGMEINLKTQKEQLVPEESGVKAPLEILNEWEGTNELLINVEEIYSFESKTFEVFDEPTPFRETLRL
ncbi:949_t:CDS:2, partial [Acaulospora morrowiae]